MARAASIAVALVALEHLWFPILEMFLWTTPLETRTFGLTPEFAEASKVLAARGSTKSRTTPSTSRGRAGRSRSSSSSPSPLGA